MDPAEQNDSRTYKVVINDEEQYSIWPADQTTPDGWRDAGKNGPKDECVTFIRKVWTDMRPASLREKIEDERKGKA
jgi:MbtH protein